MVLSVVCEACGFNSDIVTFLKLWLHASFRVEMNCLVDTDLTMMGINE